MFFFPTRSAARAYAVKTGRKITDMGSSAATGKRWGVKVLRTVVC